MRFITVLFLGMFFAQSTFAYWQQKVDHKISVTLDDKDHILRGYAEMTYQNNSPDTLRYIFMHLYPNAYKNDHTAFAKQKVASGDTKFYYSDKYEKGFIDSLSFTTDDLPLSYSKYNDNEDIVFLELIDPLLPGKSIEIKTPFRVVIPKTFSRLGHIGQSYQITQWYPKPAVYDQDGWHMMPYLDQGEFYYEFGDYDVEMTLPKNYIVASTGDLQTESEHAFRKTRSLSNLPTAKKIDELKAQSSSIKKTIRFTQKNVHDFAWFADKQFLISFKEFQLPSGKSCVAMSFITPNNITKYKTSAKALAETTKFLSAEVGEYPYNQISIVDGPLYAGGGMEYPNIAIIGKLPNEKTVNIVIVHEAGHNWFQGLLGSNEREHPWLDEGVNSFYEAKIVEQLKELKIPVEESGGNGIIYMLNGHAHRDQPIELRSENYTPENYGGVVYAKAAKSLEYLEDYIGAKDFKKGVQTYFKHWQQKHPAPKDFRNALENNTDKKLSWYFDDLLFNKSPIDFKIKKVKAVGENVNVSVVDRFGANYPVPVFAMRQKDTLDKQYATSGIATFKNYGKGVHYVVDREFVIPEINKANNKFKPSSLFKRNKPSIGLGTGFLKPGANKIYLLPAFGYNSYDRVMAGLAIHNLKIPNSQFQFALAPMYSFKSKQMNGTGVVGYSFYPNKTFRKVTASVQGATYSADSTRQNLDSPIYPRFYKINPRLRFDLVNKDLRSPISRSITLNYFHTAQQGYDFARDSVATSDTTVDYIFTPSIAEYDKQNLFRVNYTYRNDRTFNPYGYNLQYETTADIAKLTAEGNIKIDYFMPKKSLYLRAFAGKFFYLNNEVSAFNVSQYYLNVTPTSRNDYAYENTFLARHDGDREGYQGQQVLDREGGFATRSDYLSNPIGQTDNWLAAINVRTDIPVEFFYLPKVFFNAATFANTNSFAARGTKTVFEGGLEFGFLNDIIKIKVPLVLSKDFKDYAQSVYTKNRFGRQISFSLSTDKIDFLRTQETLTKLAF